MFPVNLRQEVAVPMKKTEMNSRELRGRDRTDTPMIQRDRIWIMRTLPKTREERIREDIRAAVKSGKSLQS